MPFTVLKNEELHIKEKSWIAALAARKMGSKNAAIVIGSTIHLHNCTRESFLKDESWVLHEKCHIAQFKRYGRLKFIFLYLLESLKKGYYHNKYEIEAREAEKIRR